MHNITVIDTCAFIHIRCISCFYLLENLKYSCLSTKFVQLEIDYGKEETKKSFYSLLKGGKISIMPLQIDDLIEMAAYPETRRLSNSELSCFVLTRRHGYKTMTDDEPAIRFALNILGLDQKKIIRLFDILMEAYENSIINDGDIKDFQKELRRKNFIFHKDLLEEASKRKYYS